jgi:hypothetical protein
MADPVAKMPASSTMASIPIEQRKTFFRMAHRLFSAD